MPPVSAPSSLGALAARIDARLDDVLAVEGGRWGDFDEALAGPFEEIGRMVRSGGKRLRPAFCFWGFVGAGGHPDDERIIDAGAALELMHAFALFHDDVMDDSSSRRGAPTTHTVYAEQHRKAAWAGESRRFGEGIAILVGDLAFVLSDQLLLGAGVEVWALWNELRLELNAGQLLDIIGAVQGERRLDKAERIARYKSGKYTIERPLHLGALLAAPERRAELLAGLSAYGLPLGDAFKMRDDVIGAFGATELTGKPVGDDLREGKPTPLLARAVALADDRQRRVLDVVGSAGMTEEHVAAAQQVIVDTGALAALEDVIERLAEEAVEALERVDLTAAARDALAELAAFVAGRTV